jgi:hypothetical protein
LCAVIALLAAAAAPAQTTEPAVTVLAGFEDASVAARIGDVRNVPAADCAVRRTSIPARGQASLAVEIGATARDVSVACDLTFREITRFRQADRVGAFCWITEGQVTLAFRVRDRRHQIFETQPETVALHNRWVFVASDLGPGKLRRVRGDGDLTYPIEILGCRVGTDRLGKQTVFLDDLQVEHRVAPRDLVYGEFEFNEPTRIYEPGSSVKAAVVLENRSRQKALDLAVDLGWTRPDGSVLQTQRADVRLPASGADFRSYRKLDFSQPISDAGLYKLVAQVRAPDWSAPHTFETAIAVTPSNRRISRGRSTFFSARTNLLAEPELDQTLEIRAARDIGVNLLAIETPWRSLAPKAGAYDFRPLETVLQTLRREDIEDMAAMFVVTEPPEWLPKDASRAEPLAAFIAALTDHAEQRVLRVQVDGAALDAPTVASQLALTLEVAQRVAQTRPKILVLPPPILVERTDAAAEVAEFLKQHSDFPLVFQTTGDPAAGRAQLDALARAGGFAWRATQSWLHVAGPLASLGYYADAEAVLRHYVAAAAAGVGGVMWSDLRDDDSDPQHRDALRGLMRRDFSPKASLLGYAVAAGQLTGYRYAGPVRGTPDDFDSALFIGGDRHVAVLLPRPNRIPPAVLMPLLGFPGEIQVYDFERRPCPVLGTSVPPLVLTSSRPQFVTLAMTSVQPEPQLAIGRPWLRVPATVLCGGEAEFAVELDAPLPLEKSYLQLRLPKDSPVESSFSAAGLGAAAGQTVRQEIRLRPKPDAHFERTSAALVLSLEGETLEIPLDVRPLAAVQPLTLDQPVNAEVHRVGTPAPWASRRVTAKLALYCAYEPAALQVALMVEDNRFVPLRVDPGGEPSGDQLLLGVAREGADARAEVRISPADEQPVLEPVYGTTPAQLEGWHCERVAGPQEGQQTYRFTISSRALGLESLSAGARLLLAVRYVDDDADGFPPVAHTWGGGLDGSRSTSDYRWVQLKGPAGRRP